MKPPVLSTQNDSDQTLEILALLRASTPVYEYYNAASVEIQALSGCPHKHSEGLRVIGLLLTEMPFTACKTAIDFARAFPIAPAKALAFEVLAIEAKRIVHESSYASIGGFA